MQSAIPVPSEAARGEPTRSAPGASSGRARLPWIVTTLLVLATTAFLFASGMSFIAGRWSEPEYSHGWLIPAVTLFILWNRRETLRAERGPGSWAGTAVVALALAVLLLSEMAFVMRGPFIALILLLLGLPLAALGWRAMRYAALPILFLAFAFPLPGSLAVPLSTSLQLISSQLGTAMLQLLGISVYLEGNVIDLGVYKLQVAEACSGLRYLFPLASFGFLCAWMYRGPLWARALLLVSTIPITIVTNSARIALTGVFVEHGSIALAEGFMHLFEGWVIFIVALAILFAEMWIISRLLGNARHPLDLLDFDRLAGGARQPAPVSAAASTAPERVPAPFLACAALLVIATLGHNALVNREQIVPPRPGLATFPFKVEGWTGQPIPVTDASVLRSLGASDYLLADYARPGETAVNLWIAYYGNQLGDAAIHSPKDCLPGGGWEYETFGTIDSPAPGWHGKPFEINRGVIAKGLDRMIIYYWLEMRGRQVTADAALKIYNLVDSYRMGRSDGALVRLMTPVAPGEPLEAADERLRGFMRGMYPLLEPHVGS